MDVSATLKGQYGLNIRPDIYRLNGRQRISGELRIEYFPDLFYGIGPQTPDDFEEEFTSRYVETIIQFEQEIATNIKAGIRSHFRYEHLLEVESGGQLEMNEVVGSQGSTVFGIGIVASWDSRNRIFYPHSGFWGNVSALLYPESFISQHNFSQIILDTQKYFPLSTKQVLAFQFYIEGINREVPFPIPPNGWFTVYTRFL